MQKKGILQEKRQKMHKKKKDNRGGPGRNQGRKLKYGEETINLSIRVPVSKKEELRKIVNAKLKKWAQGSRSGFQ